MYNKNNFAIHKATSKHCIKPEFRMVALYGDRSIATDSFRLIEMSATGEAHPPRLYPADLIKSVKIKKNETMAEDDIPVKPWPDDNYPDVDQVLKSHFDKKDDPERYSTIKLNGEYLEQVFSVLKNLNAFKAVEISVPTTPGSPVLVTAETTNKGHQDIQKARAIIMPLNR